MFAEYLDYNYVPVYGSVHIFSATKEDWFAICLHIDAPLVQSSIDDELRLTTHNTDLQKVELACVEMPLMQLTSFDSGHESTGGQVLDNSQSQ